MGIKIGIDTMGGDYGIEETVKGSILALKELSNLELVLYGREEELKLELSKHKYDVDKIQIVHADEVVEPTDTPTKAVREKTNSSMAIGLKDVKQNKTMGFVSCGNTGALLAGATFTIGRIKGIKRPALATLLPNNEGFHMLMDVGANIDPKPLYLKQFAILGSIYYGEMMNKENPSVAIINVGVEKNKGNDLVNEAYDLLQDTNLNFKGFVEPRDIPSGMIDVSITDAFTGNVILKYTEGFAKTLSKGLVGELKKNIFTIIGTLFVVLPLFKFKKKYDYKEIGGAPLLGLNNLVVKAHGSSDAKAFKGAIRQCYNFIEKDITGKIIKELENEK